MGQHRFARAFIEESRAITRERVRKLEIVKKRARELLKALDDIDTHGRSAIQAQMIIADGRSLLSISRAEFTRGTTRLTEERDFLAKPGAIAPREFWKLGPGQPSNLPAYLVLQDAAALFEWLTGTKAARGVDRIDGSESGPFFRFASVLWPVVFGKGTAGLPAAMKNWAQWRSRYHERSELISNMALGHPTWGIFER